MNICRAVAFHSHRPDTIPRTLHITMAVRRTRIAVVDLSGHHKIFRCYIEMHALADAYAKAKAVSGRLFRTGSEASWIDFRNKMEQNLRSEYRKVYEREVRQKLSATAPCLFKFFPLLP